MIMLKKKSKSKKYFDNATTDLKKKKNTTQTEAMKYLLLLSQTHMQFRLAELTALAQLENIAVDLSSHDESSPFMIVELENDEAAKKLIRRSVLAKSIYELWGGPAASMEELHEQIKTQTSQLWPKYATDSFKFEIIGYQSSRPKEEFIKMVEGFSYMDFKGKIKMKSPDHVFTILEDYRVIGQNPEPAPARIFFGRHIANSNRSAMDTFDLKKRKYIGTTSFDAELSLLTCNLAHVKRNGLMYDPFAGTGSFLVAAAAFGALTVGSDIDVRMIRGKGKGCDIPANFKQYNSVNRLLDVLAVDFTNNSFRKGLKFDSIVCDPPYGVREGLKVLGVREEDVEKKKHLETTLVDGQLAHTRRDYIPPKKPFEFGKMMDALLSFSAERLVEDGRLAFWMPTANQDYTDAEIPLHEDLELICNCVQDFNQWSRRCLVYRRRKEGDKGELRKTEGGKAEDFRVKYFKGFKNE
ncbi:uncharacterized protein YALI1_C19510g [Yarrowia lipolytica]|nr:hypothetical protein YALI1_C19510g [Yarrowia lipolytica]